MTLGPLKPFTTLQTLHRTPPHAIFPLYLNRIRFVIKGLLYAAAIYAAAIGSTASAETFNNDSVIALARAGVGDDVLLSKVNSLPCSYDLSTEQLIRLRKSGISNAVLSAMVDRCAGASRAQGLDQASANPLVKRTPGLYLKDNSTGTERISIIRPITVSGIQISGNGSILFPFIAKLMIPRPAAQTLADSRSPVFYFYFEAADSKVGDFGTSASKAAQSPSEFSMVRFKAERNQRQMFFGRFSAFNTQLGIDPKYTIPFSINEIDDSVFEVKMNNALEPGQYGFILKVGNGAYRVYDFQIN